MKHHGNETVRNEALRLTLAGQEGDFIQQQLAAARKSLKTLAHVAVSGGVLLAFILLFTESDYYFKLEFTDPERHEIFRVISLGAGVISGIATFIAVLKLPLAYFAMAKYESYRHEHGRFLEKYNRNRQGGPPRA